MFKAQMGLVVLLSLFSGLSFSSSFSLNSKVAKECTSFGNFNNLEFSKSFCIVTAVGPAEIKVPTLETFSGDCSVTASVVGTNKVELVFIKNPSHFNYSTHVEWKEARNCLLSLVSEDNSSF